MTSRRIFWLTAAPLLTLTAVACSKQSPSIVDPHGPEARRIAGIWWLMFGLAAGVYIIVAGFILFAVVRGRRTESGKPSRVSENTFIWWGGIIIPVVILAVLAVETVSAVSDVRKPEASPLRIEVTGKRWWWDVRYPDQGIVTANEIHIPTGRQIEIGLDSDNVIHSFWVPQLAGKLDMIPGQHNVLRLKADTPGTYRGQCAEYCGLEHGRMVFLVVADPPDVFDRWAARYQLTPSPPEDEAAARGQVVFNREPCAGCHTIKGTSATGTYGPDLTNFGSRTSIGSVTVSNTPSNLAGWIANAQSIKPGNLMPPIALSSSDLNDLVAYLESLK